MKRVLLPCVYLMLASSTLAQSTKSDELFAKGVEMYHQERYAEAIPFFEECDSLDRAELDSTSNRLGYSKLWMASAYFHLGNKDKASTITPFYLATPVDRRLTVKSDSVSTLMHECMERREYVHAINLCNEMMELEKQVVGENHYFIANDYSILAYLYMETGDMEKWCEYLTLYGDIYRLTFGDVPLGYGEAQLWLMSILRLGKRYNEALGHMRKLQPVFRTHDAWAKENAEQIFLFCDYMLDDYPLNEELTEELARFALPLYDIPEEMKGSWWYGHIIKRCAEALQSQQQYNKVLEICKSALSHYIVSGVRNSSRYIIDEYLFVMLESSYSSISDNQPADIRTGIEKMMLDIADDAMHTLEQTVGKNNREWANMAISKAIILTQSKDRSDYDRSKQLIDAGFAILTSDVLLTDTVQVGKSLSMLSRSYECFNALNYQEKFVEYAERLTSHPFATFEKYNLAWFFLALTYSSIKMDRKTDAIALYRRLADFANKEQEDEMYAEMLNHIYFEEYFSHQYAQAFQTLQQLNLHVEKHNTLSSYNTANSRAKRAFRMAECSFHMNDTLNTIAYQQQAMQILRHCIDTNNDGDESYTLKQKVNDLKELADIANNGSNVTWVTRTKADVGIPYLEEALAVVEKAYEENRNEGLLSIAIELHLSIAMSCMGYKVNKARIAKEHIEKARELCTDTLSYQYARVLFQTGHYYEDMSIEPELALQYYFKAFELNNEIIADRNPYDTSLINSSLPVWQCAELCFYLGNDLDGLEYQRKYLNAQKQQYGHDIGGYEARAIEQDIKVHSPAMVRDYRHWKYEENQHIDIDRCRLLADSLETVYMNDTLYQTHVVYFKMRDVCEGFDQDLAKDYERKAVKAIMSLPSGERYNDTYFFHYLLHGAEQNGPKQVISIGKQLSGYYKGNSNAISQYITTLWWMAKAYTQMNNGQQALDCYKEATAMAMESDYDNYRLPLGFALAADSCQNYSQIAPFYSYICDAVQKEVLSSFEEAREDEREEFWRQCERVFSIGENVLDSDSSKAQLTRIYNNLLFRKSILLNSSISAMNLIQTEGDSLLLAKYDKKEWLKKQLMKSDTGDIRSYNGKTLSREVAVKLVKRFENEIMRRATILGNYTSALVTTCDDVKAALHANETAIEFTCYHKSGEDIYAAIVLQGDGHLCFVPLCTQEELNKAIETHDNGSNVTWKCHTLLYNLIWEPLLPYISNKKNVYFSPDAGLHSLPLESCMAPSGQYASEAFSLYRVSSTRELAKARIIKQLQTAVLYGGIKYELEQQERTKSKQTPSYVFRDAPDIKNIRGAVKSLPYLPGSKEEVDSINTILQNKHIAVTLNDGTNGTEESFKALSGKQTPLVHISTHGFYEQQDDLDSQFRDHEYTALTRTGLLMAGAANCLYDGDPSTEHEDGILTAHEISKLDFRKLGTVVLSACDTGLGEITGDGVFGLQRGFKKAGANSILMSLWKVDDEATCLLMTEFYKNWIGKGQTKHDALELAKQTVHSHKEKGWDDPKYWAAFILLDALD